MVVGLLLGAAALATLLIGRVAVSGFVALVVLAAYIDLRRLLAPWGHVITVALGALGVAGFLWSGYSGRLDLLASTGAALVLALLVTRVLLYELGARSSTGTTFDIASTLGAAGVAGVLGAHVLLIRSVDRFGFRGLLCFGLMVIANDVVAFAVERWRGFRRHPPATGRSKSWPGVAAGFVASVAVGVVAGAVLDPPFDFRSGALLGIGMGVLVPLGELGFAAIKRSAGVRVAGTYLGPMGGALDAVDGLLFSAPAFYWALRTLAL
ncbi:MAG: phosphatidate cytidylyltransferase [Actinomycetota bacterium]